MTPLQKYNHLLHTHAIRKDPEQQRAIHQLEHIYHELILRQRQRNSTLGKIHRFIKPRAPIHGLYLWGKVGTGKTFLLDMFYQALPTTKIRLHFHEFMHDIHNRLQAIQGEPNPLEKIGRQIADSTVVICFDEFVVHNIADAMILSELFDALFRGGVCLIATSNTPPDELYKNGLQRQRFLPAIDLVKKYTSVMHVSTTTDYRRRHLAQAGVYFTPLDDHAHQLMDVSFNALAGNDPIHCEPLELLGRRIEIVRRAGKTIWFNFPNICGRPRSQLDYLELVKAYDTVMISNIPVIQPHQTDLVTSFINLIDVFYDAHIRVIISAAATPEGLYPQGAMAFDYRRTCSRLIEMQSQDYFQQ